MRIDIMTDIETLGTNSDSTIIQLSAIAFDIKTGTHIAKFDRIADLDKNREEIKVTSGTLKWWMNTNKDLFQYLLLNGTISSEQIIREFHTWLRDLKALSNGKPSNSIHLWGNGILFDNKMIKHQMEALKLHYPIPYPNDRDLRTLVDLAAMKLGVSVQELKETFNSSDLVAHNAFDDVQYQINVAVGCYNVLMGGKA